MGGNREYASRYARVPCGLTEHTVFALTMFWKIHSLPFDSFDYRGLIHKWNYLVEKSVNTAIGSSLAAGTDIPPDNPVYLLYFSKYLIALLSISILSCALPNR